MLRLFSGYRIFALLSVFLQVVSILALKYLAMKCGGLFCWPLIYYYAAVAGLIFLRVISWNLALTKGNLRNVYAFTALNPVLLLWLSSVVFDEKVSLISALGTSIIVFAI